MVGHDHGRSQGSPFIHLEQLAEDVVEISIVDLGAQSLQKSDWNVASTVRLNVFTRRHTHTPPVPHAWALSAVVRLGTR